VRSLMVRGASTKRVVTHSLSGKTDATMMSDGPTLGTSHAWVNRSMRSYAVASEFNDMASSISSSSSKSSVPELLPNVIAKGSGPLAQVLRRSDSTVSPKPQRRRPALRKQGSAFAASSTDLSEVEPSSPVTSFDSSKKTPRSAWGDPPRSGSRKASRAGNRTHTASSASSASEASVHALVEVVSTRTVASADDAAPSEQSGEPEPLVGMPIVPQPSFGVVEPASHRPRYLPTIPSMSCSRTGSRSVSFMGRRRYMSPERIALYIVRNFWFENLTLGLILLNTIMIGAQTNYCATRLVQEGPHAFHVVEIASAAFFVLELSLRLFAYKRRFFTMQGWCWNVLDFVVVLFQVVDVGLTALRITKSGVPIALSLVRLLRVLRIIRIVRVVRLLRYMSELRTIVVSLSSSMKPLLSTIVLLALVVYVVGIYFTQLTLDYRIAHADTEAARELEEYFGSVSVSVMSLFQTVTGGLEWRDMVLPLMRHVSPAMGIVFGLYIVFTSMALMNIVTGVFVETALQRGREDKDVYMINHLKEVFGLLDINRVGTISWSELEAHLDDAKLRAFFKDIDIDISEARGLFHLLDRDRSGTIDADEFLGGCLRLRGPAKSLDMQLVIRELADQRIALEGLLSRPVAVAIPPAHVEHSDGDSGTACGNFSDRLLEAA